MFTTVRRGSLRLLGTAILTLALATAANQLAKASDTCVHQCKKGSLTCPPEGLQNCTCETWNSAIFACGGGENSGGCSYSCGGSSGTLCCKDLPGNE